MKVDPDMKSLMKAVRKVAKPVSDTVQARVHVNDSQRVNDNAERAEASERQRL